MKRPKKLHWRRRAKPAHYALPTWPKVLPWLKVADSIENYQRGLRGLRLGLPDQTFRAQVLNPRPIEPAFRIEPIPCAGPPLTPEQELAELHRHLHLYGNHFCELVLPDTQPLILEPLVMDYRMNGWDAKRSTRY
jgi:hypothetical protein